MNITFINTAINSFQCSYIYFSYQIIVTFFVFLSRNLDSLFNFVSIGYSDDIRYYFFIRCAQIKITVRSNFPTYNAKI